MTQEEKQLLLVDLSARLPYGIMITMGGRPPMRLEYIHNDWDFGDAYCMCSEFQYEIEECKPYLRPISSMTEEEKKELIKEFWGSHTIKDRFEEVCWYLSKHFDINGLIEKGLALVAPKGMYETEEQKN